jgi:hypothetical protein
MAMPKVLERTALSALRKLGEAHVGQQGLSSRPGAPVPLRHAFDTSVVNLYRILLSLYAAKHADQARSGAPAQDELAPRLPGHEAFSMFGKIEFSEIGISDIARLYENLLQYSPEPGTGSRRKSSGSYYTPDRVIRYVVERTLGPIVEGKCRCDAGRGPLLSSEILRLRIIDPAMGSGLFLLEAMDYLARAYCEALVREGNVARAGGARETASHRLRVAEHCLFGLDIDPIAVKIAKLCLGMSLVGSLTPPAFLDGHLKCGDSLLGFFCGGSGGFASGQPATLGADRPPPEAAGIHKPFAWKHLCPSVFRTSGGLRGANAGFDAVFGNPPYLSFSGKHKGAIDSRAEIYKALAPPGGWLTTHGLFMITCADLAKVGGLVSLVVPDQVGHLKGYGPVRARMLKVGDLLEVRYWGEDLFPGVTTPSLTFLFRKGRREQRTRARVIHRSGKQIRFQPEGDAEWYDLPLRRVYHRLMRQHRAVSSFSDTGVHTGNMAKQLILMHARKGAVPVLEGRQVHPFHCDPPAKWLDINCDPGPGEYFRVSPARVYQSADILLRQTARRPTAARHIYRCHFRNSVLALKVPEGFSTEYLLGLLNSEAVAWLYGMASLESRQRAFPQVKVMHLRRLPVPDPRIKGNRRIAASIERLVRKIESGIEHDAGRGPLMSRLDHLVWRLYDLNPQEILKYRLV